MDGLRPCTVILIAASKYSNTDRNVRWLEMRAFGGTWSKLCVNLLSSMRVFVFLGLLLPLEFIPSPNTSTTVSRTLSARIPSNLRPASSKLI